MVRDASKADPRRPYLILLLALRRDAAVAWISHWPYVPCLSLSSGRQDHDRLPSATSCGGSPGLDLQHAIFFFVVRHLPGMVLTGLTELILRPCCSADSKPHGSNCRILKERESGPETGLRCVSADMQRAIESNLATCCLCAWAFHLVIFGSWDSQWTAQCLFHTLDEISQAPCPAYFLPNSTDHYNLVGFFFPSTMTPSSTPASRWDASCWLGRNASSPENRLVFQLAETSERTSCRCRRCSKRDPLTIPSPRRRRESCSRC